MPHPANLSLAERVTALEAHRSHDTREVTDVLAALKSLKTRVRGLDRISRLALGTSLAALSVAANLRAHELVMWLKSLSSLLAMIP